MAIADAYAWIFDLWKVEPVYHRALPAYPTWTYCGRKVGEAQTPIPSMHACKIGRPCKTCYPGGN